MSDVVVFHHALGLTSGCRTLAERFEGDGRRVHTPDLYDGRTFSELSAGVAYAQEIGFDHIAERGRAAAEELTEEAVYIGISLGVLPVELLAQTRSGARGAVLVSGAVPLSEFGGAWPAGVPLQIHMMDADPLVTDEGDLATAHGIVATLDDAELHLYHGSSHLFVDDSLADYDESATALVVERVLRLLTCTRKT